VNQKEVNNINSVMRLIANNPIAMSKYIPSWQHSAITTIKDSSPVDPAEEGSFLQDLWQLDDTIAHSAPFIKYPAYPQLAHKFAQANHAIHLLRARYDHPPKCINPSVSTDNSLPGLWQHAIIMAHIAAKRTDDPKIGVGAVLVYADGSYGSVGWNGYPKKADILDYPQAGADDFIEHELKYDYIMHAGKQSL
jgi:hypothetical protein